MPKREQRMNPRHPSRKTYGLEESDCNAGRRVDDVLDAGPRRRRRIGERPSAPPPAARVARPRTSLLRINFAASNALYKEQTAWLAVNAERPDGPPADDAA